jgi:endonuclease/exonuclease/phosphatase family metal-dependent hydrolase
MLVTLSPALVSAQVAGDSGDGRIRVLSYNVHGLFRSIAKDQPRDRMPTIAWLANHYDVVLFQEDFEYHDVIRDQMNGSIGVQGNGMGWDLRRVGAKMLLSPVSIFIPHFSPPYGAGISTFLRQDLVIEDDVTRESYGVCHGWFGANGDCWANKGFLRVGFRTPNGAEIDVYNTHLEAGATQESVETRIAQLDVMADAIEARGRERAVIVAADFNSDFKRPGDRAAILDFRNRLGLADSGAGPELPIWRERDYILFREGTRVAVEVEQAGEGTSFVNRGRALSDHPAIYTTFRFEPREPDEQEPSP